jgi:hypothetical protein
VDDVAFAQVNLVEAPFGHQVLARSGYQETVRGVTVGHAEVRRQGIRQLADAPMPARAHDEVALGLARGSDRRQRNVQHVATVGLRTGSRKMFEGASAVALAQLADALQPPVALGPYRLTGQLAASATALVYTAEGGAFGTEEGVLKLSNSHHAARLSGELQRLVRCADAGVEGVVRPLARDIEWLPVSGVLDEHVACLAMPFLSGGDLRAARRAGLLQGGSVVEVALRVGGTLRHLLEMPQHLVHGSLGARSALLPRPGASLSEAVLIDFGNARELSNCSKAEAAELARADVAAFGALLEELSNGSERLGNVIANCRARRYATMADARLWRDVMRARAAKRWWWPW